MRTGSWGISADVGIGGTSAAACGLPPGTGVSVGTRSSDTSEEAKNEWPYSRSRSIFSLTR